jgi:hypothetical protein
MGGDTLMAGTFHKFYSDAEFRLWVNQLESCRLKSESESFHRSIPSGCALRRHQVLSAEHGKLNAFSVRSVGYGKRCSWPWNRAVTATLYSHSNFGHCGSWPLSNPTRSL